MVFLLRTLFCKTKPLNFDICFCALGLYLKITAPKSQSSAEKAKVEEKQQKDILHEPLLEEKMQNMMVSAMEIENSEQEDIQIEMEEKSENSSSKSRNNKQKYENKPIPTSYHNIYRGYSICDPFYILSDLILKFSDKIFMSIEQRFTFLYFCVLPVLVIAYYLIVFTPLCAVFFLFSPKSGLWELTWFFVNLATTLIYGFWCFFYWMKRKEKFLEGNIKKWPLCLNCTSSPFHMFAMVLTTILLFIPVLLNALLSIVCLIFGIFYENLHQRIYFFILSVIWCCLCLIVCVLGTIAFLVLILLKTPTPDTEPRNFLKRCISNWCTPIGLRRNFKNPNTFWFPWFFKPVWYLLCYSVIVLACAGIVLYGVSFGDKAVEWILVCFLSCARFFFMKILI